MPQLPSEVQTVPAQIDPYSFTRAEWKVGFLGSDYAVYADGVEVLTIYPCDEDAANVALVGAAPHLYRELDALITFICGDQHDESEIDKAFNTPGLGFRIAKARRALERANTAWVQAG